MASLLVLCPSRERPQNAGRLLDAITATQTHYRTRLMVITDGDDPDSDLYDELPCDAYVARGGQVRGMTAALNEAAAEVLRWSKPPSALAFMGDDHLPRTQGWDAAYLDALADLGGTGIVYGDDLYQGEAMPTQVAMSMDIVRALGWMAPPQLQHLNIDMYWKALGDAIGRLCYLPDVVVEHMHPVLGKAELDAGYASVNNPDVIGRDGAAYWAMMRDGTFDQHVETIREACNL